MRPGKALAPGLFAPLLLVLVIAVGWAPTADAAFHLSGSWRTGIEVMNPKEKWNLTSRSTVTGTMRFVPDDRPNVLAVVDISGTRTAMSLSGGNPLAIAPERIGVGEAYIQVASAVLSGGHEWLFRFGSQNARRAGFLSQSLETDGVTVSNINISNRFNGQLFYLWGLEPNVALMGAQVVGFVGAASVSMGFAQRAEAREFGAEAHIPLVPGRMFGRVGAAYSFGRIHRVQAGSTFAPAPGWKLDYQYQYTDLLRPFEFGFTPPMPTHVHVVKAETSLAEHNVTAELQVMRGAMESMKTAVTAERTAYIGKTMVGLSYAVKDVPEAPKFEFAARTNVDVAGLRRVALRGTVGYDTPGAAGGDGLFTWSVQASHNSSQGLNMAAGYHSVNGPKFSVGVTVGF